MYTCAAKYRYIFTNAIIVTVLSQHLTLILFRSVEEKLNEGWSVNDISANLHPLQMKAARKTNLYPLPFTGNESFQCSVMKCSHSSHWNLKNENVHTILYSIYYSPAQTHIDVEHKPSANI